MSQTALTRQTSVADALANVQDAFQNPGEKVPIPHASSDVSLTPNPSFILISLNIDLICAQSSTSSRLPETRSP